MEERVNTFMINHQVASEIVALADGGWVVVWEGGDDGSLRHKNIFLQRFSATGEMVGEEVLVNTTTPSSQRNPSVDALPDGGWIVTWHFYSNADPEDSASIYTQRYTALCS